MLTARQQHCLRGIGITHWKPRAPIESDARKSLIEDKVESTVESGDQIQAPAQPLEERHSTLHFAPVSEPELTDWPQTLQAIEQCRQCELSNNCTQKVPGKGFQQADLLIIGEAPGHEEDLKGLPFVGRAGKLLDKMLLAIDIDPKKVYITNILKCRPPNNRDPRAEEVAACSRFLEAQIKLIQPRVIFSVGRISAQNLLQQQTPVGKLRGRQHVLPTTDIPLLVTYHPAYLLRNPAEKARVWQDLKDLNQLLKQG